MAHMNLSPPLRLRFRQPNIPRNSWGSLPRVPDLDEVDAKFSENLPKSITYYFNTVVGSIIINNYDHKRFSGLF